jgi:phosphonate transport system ATP-binding protein
VALVPGLRVIQNVVTGRAGRRSLWRCLRDVLFTSPEDTREIHALLERTGIPEKLYHRTGHLSGGQQQRVAVARALFQKPDALLADEPVSSIDPARARDTVDLLTRLSGEDGLPLVMSLHNLELAREFFPRLIGLRFGRVVFDKPSWSLSGAEFNSLYRLTREELLADG